MHGILSMVPLLLFALSISCCVRHSEALKSMDLAESLMECNPDSALKLLQEVDTLTLRSKEAKARYALLRSIAFDKNYIDTTTFDVLQPAIDYYLDNGTPNERLRTYYYQGCIYNNMKDDDNTLRSLRKGEELFMQATDTLTMARLKVLQSVVYYRYYRFKDEVDALNQAAELYKEKGKEELYASCLTYLLGAHLMLKNKIQSDSISQLCEIEFNKGLIEPIEYHKRMLGYEIRYKTSDDVRKRILLLKEMPYLDVDAKLELASAYNATGNWSEALGILDNLTVSERKDKYISYVANRAIAKENLGRYTEALSLFKEFQNLMFDEQNTMIENKINSLEERHAMELQAQNKILDKNKRIWFLGTSAILLMSLSLFLLIFARYNKTKRILAETAGKKTELENRNLKLKNKSNDLEIQVLRNRIETLERDRDELSFILHENNSLPNEVKQSIRDRIELLNSILADQIQSKIRNVSYEKWAERQISDADIFMNRTRLAFKVSHPDFIAYFEKHNLSIPEINYVCLYAIGLNGKEVGLYLERAGHINMSSAIRKKLGLGIHDTNLRNHIMEMLRTL